MRESAMGRRVAIGACGVAISHLFVDSGNAGPENGTADDPWKIFSTEFGIGNPGSLLKLRFEVPKNKRAPSQFSLPIETTILVEEKIVLLRVGKAANHAMTRAVSNDMHGGAGGDVSVASVEMTTANGKMSIYLTSLGFSLDVKATLHGVFYSWILARVLDDLYFADTGYHLPPSLFSALVGDGTREHEKKVYYDSFSRE